MQPSTFVNRVTNYSKLVKFNILMLAMVLIASTMAVTFATSTGGSKECGAHVALVLDRSASISVDQFSGSRANSLANITAIQNGSFAFIDAVQGKDSYSDLYAFGSVAQRINTGGWFNLYGNFSPDVPNVNLQNLVIGTTKFKQGANSNAEDAYNDGMNAAGEGLTNWQGAIQRVLSDQQNPFPSHIVMFTDGNPTTNQTEVDKAIAAGGSFRAAGYPANVDEPDADDISEGVRVADLARAIGVKIIPIGVGNVNRSNLQALAGPGNPVYYSNNYAGLTDMFKAAAANVCEEPAKDSTLRIIATDKETGKQIPAKFDYSDSPFTGPQFQTTGEQGAWATKVAQPKTNWGFKTSLVAGSTPGYDFDSVNCRSGEWSASSPLTGVARPGGIDSSPGGYAPGTTISCEYIFKKTAVDGIELQKTVDPTTAKRGEAVTYTFRVKNTGNTKLTNIVVTDPMLNGEVGRIASLEKGATSDPITKGYTIPDNASGSITNTATATGTPIDSDGSTRPNVSDTDDAVVTIILRQSQQIEKSVTPSVAGVGTEVTYTISVKNTGESPISNVQVTDATLNKELTIPGPIAPGATGSVQVKYTLKAGDFKNGIFTNVACLKGTDTCDDAKVMEPKVELTKSGPDSARPGEKVKFTFKVKNTGIVDLTNIEIKDETLSKYTSSPVVIKVDGTLKPGESSTLKTYEFTIPQDFKGNIFENVAVVHSNPIDPSTDKPVTGIDVKDDDDHSITIIRWTATKKADVSVVVPGTTVNYTISVKNEGGTVLKNVQVSDPTIGFPEDGKPVVFATIAVGETKTVTAKYVVPANFTGKTFKNVALVCVVGPPTENPNTPTTTVPGTKPEGADCQEPSVTVDVAKISLTKTADKETSYPGQKVVYTFVVENTGNVAIDPGVITDDILGEIGDPKVLQPGDKETFTKEYTVEEDAEEGSKVINVATVCAPVPGTTPGTSTVTTDCKTTCPTDSLTQICAQDEHTLLIEIPSITIDKTADKATANVGDTVNYTFVVTNNSKVDLKDITVTDNVLGDLPNIDELKAGESKELNLAYVVPTTAATAGTIRNVATACFATPEFDDNCASDDHTLTVVRVGGVTVTRPVAAGPSLAFTGSQSGWLALIAGLIIALGATLFMVSRRRKGELS